METSIDLHWESIFGNIDLSNDEISLNEAPIPPTAPGGALVAPHAVVRSNIEFEQGRISLEVMFTEADSRCQIGIPDGQGGDIYAGLNILGAVYGFAVFRNSQWEPLVGAGHGSRIAIHKWHKLVLDAQGSNLELYVNGVKVAVATQRIQRGPVNLLLQGLSKIIVRNIEIEQKPSICFVVMQFTDEFNALYEEVIRPTCESYGFKVVRADDIYSSGLIIQDITRSIKESAIVIADITPNNPNVFYEVGFAHGISKPTILLSDRKREKLPFDVSGFRTLFYDNTIGGKSAVEERLKKHLDNINA